MKCIELERQHQLAITELQEQLQAEHNQLLEDIKMKSQEKEQDLQNEVNYISLVVQSSWLLFIQQKLDHKHIIWVTCLCLGMLLKKRNAS